MGVSTRPTASFAPYSSPYATTVSDAFCVRVGARVAPVGGAAPAAGAGSGVMASCRGGNRMQALFDPLDEVLGERQGARERGRDGVEDVERAVVTFVAEVHLQAALAQVEQLGPDPRTSPAAEPGRPDAFDQRGRAAHHAASPVRTQLRQGEPAEAGVVAYQHPQLAGGDGEALPELEIAPAIVVLAPERRRRGRTDLDRAV